MEGEAKTERAPGEEAVAWEVEVIEELAPDCVAERVPPAGED